MSEMFAALGAYVIQADEIAHDLIRPGEAVYREVVSHFGSGIRNEDGTVNRRKLAELVFGSASDKSRIDELNKIVHPAVIQRQEEWMAGIAQRDPQAIALVEAALILEAGIASSFDNLIVVTCKPEQRVERWAHRVGMDLQSAEREITRRMATQFPQEEKIKAADYLIDNSGTLEETKRQVEKIYEALKHEM